MSGSSDWSNTWTFFENGWHQGNVPIMGPRTHAAWAASSVFDGARSFEGVAPDLERHCARVNISATKMRLIPLVSSEKWIALALEGLKRFDRNVALYIRPMYWAEKNARSAVAHDPESTRWCLTMYEAPMPAPTGFSLTLSPFRRPTIDTMPAEAKAGCLYPNNARALMEAESRGFDNAVLCDMLGNVAEFTNSNIFIVKDNVVHTPAANGSFLNGITRQRIVKLLRESGIDVREVSLRYGDLEGADEIFSSGNHAKVLPATRIDDRTLAIGPMFKKARDAYWAFAHEKA